MLKQQIEVEKVTAGNHAQADGRNGWTDRVVDGWWMDGWMDGWIDGWMDGWTIAWRN